MPIDLAHDAVTGSEIALVNVEHDGGGAMLEPFAALSSEPRSTGVYKLRFTVASDARAIEIPPCAGRGAITIDGAAKPSAPGPAIYELAAGAAHEITIAVKVSSYEKRLRCSYAPIAGTIARKSTGIVRLTFASPSARSGGGKAVLYVPSHAENEKLPLLVGVHPWNGDEWTYANYTELLRAAETEHVALLFPNGLGNSLYVRAAEEEVMRALDQATRAIAIDPARVSIWGASMGGQGATTIGWHHPDRFATVTSFFGDARFDTSGYVKSILPTEDAAHLVNPLDVAENARHQHVVLFHGEDDHTSPIRESILLDDGLRKLGYDVTFVRHAKMGHEAPMIMLHVDSIVKDAATRTIPASPSRVTWKSVRAEDTSAYGVTIERAHSGDALIDLEKQPDGAILVRAADNVKKVVLAPRALGGVDGTPRIVTAPGVRTPAFEARRE